MVSDKTIHKAFRIHKLYKQNPLEIFFFFFTMYQNYTMALTHWRKMSTKRELYDISYDFLGVEK